MCFGITKKHSNARSSPMLLCSAVYMIDSLMLHLSSHQLPSLNHLRMLLCVYVYFTRACTLPVPVSHALLCLCLCLFRPDGKQVLTCLAAQDVYKSPLLHIRRTWQGRFQDFKTFGSGYTFAIAQVCRRVSWPRCAACCMPKHLPLCCCSPLTMSTAHQIYE